MKGIAAMIFCMLLFNLISGCLEFGIWKITVKRAARRVRFKPDFGILLLSVATLMVPMNSLLYVMWVLAKTLILGEMTYPYEMRLPGALRFVVPVLMVIWIFGIIGRFTGMARSDRRLRQGTRFGEPLPELYEHIFEQEYKRLGIKEGVKIQKNRYVKSPYVFYSRGCYYVQFPAELPDEEEFRVVCRHELCHVRHKDCRVSRLVSRLLSLSWFNGSSKDLAGELDMWMDICRDVEVISFGDVDSETYYGYLAENIRRLLGEEEYLSGGRMQFARENSLLYGREIVMSHFSGKKKLITGIRLAVLTGVFVVASVGATFAGMETTRRGYVRLYEKALKQAMEAEELEEAAEYEEATTETPYMIVSMNPNARLATLTWTVICDDRMESVSIHMKKGQTLTMAGIGSPSSVSFKYGYTDHVTDHYCIGQGGYTHDFKITATNDYSLYIRNQALFTNLTITISYDIN